MGLLARLVRSPRWLAGWAVNLVGFGTHAVALHGGLLAQDAFASGSLPTALTAMAVTDPVASWVIGALVFDLHPPAGPTALLGSAAAGLLVVAGVAVLANSPTLHERRAPVRTATARQESLHRWRRLSGQSRRGRSMGGRSIVDGRSSLDVVVERQHPVDGRRPLEALGRGARGRAALVGGGAEQSLDTAG